MSKILIDRDVLESISDYADKNYYFDLNYDDWEVKKIREALKEAEQKETSVIEWRGFDETPESGKAILMRWNDGSISTIQPGDFWPSIDDVDAWAYLP